LSPLDSSGLSRSSPSEAHVRPAQTIVDVNAFQGVGGSLPT
jgi:hypothetical protein